MEKNNKNLSLFLFLGIALLIFSIIFLLIFLLKSEKNPFKNELKDYKVDFQNAAHAVSNPNLEKRAEYIIENEEDFKKIFIDSDSKIFDFKSSTLIAVFLGEKLTAGYSIKIEDIVASKKNLKVYVKVISPGENCLTAPVITYPFDLVIIDKVDNPLVTFFYSNEVNNC